VGGQFGLSGWFWDGIGALNDNFNALGFVIIGVFMATWVVSIVVYRYRGLEHLDVEPATLAGTANMTTFDGDRGR
jgi:high-affinity nickel-transport protein